MAKKSVYAVVRLPTDASQYRKKWLIVQKDASKERETPAVSIHLEFDNVGLFIIREDDPHAKEMAKAIVTVMKKENTEAQARIVGPFEDKCDKDGNVLDSAEQQALRAARDAAPLTTAQKLEKTSAENSVLQNKLAELQSKLAAKAAP